MNHFDYEGVSYFGMKIARGQPMKALPRMALFQVFRRSLDGGVVQGLSVGQIARRHLLYVGSDRGALRLCLGFVWVTKSAS